MRASRFHILGLGESLEEYQPDNGQTIGVNDIHSRVKTDYVVCVDGKKAFTPERQKTILETDCKGFFTQCDDWQGVTNFNKIELAAGRGNLKFLDSRKFVYSISSPYVAVILAYKLCASEIILHGVDFKTHKNFKDNKLKRALEHFEALNIKLKEKKVDLYVGSEYSALSEFIEVWQPDDKS